MGGFLNLVEAFLAFALTMLALSTAVSAIVEVGYGLYRWRTKGLRDMIVHLFDKTIRPLWRKTVGATAPSANDPIWETRRRDFILSVTMATIPQHGAVDEPEVKDQIKKYDEFKGLTTQSYIRPYIIMGPKWFKFRGAKWYQNVVFIFIANCFILLNNVLLGLFARWPLNVIIHIINWTYRFFMLWPSLRYGLASLPAKNLKTSFEASEAGKEIKDKSKNSAEWRENLKAVVDAFKMLEGGATDQFLRKSRYFTISVGFVLAFAINVDSFDLLNSYLTDPELRALVIEQSETILKDAQSRKPGQEPGDDEASDDETQDATPLETQINSLIQTLDSVSVSDPSIQARVDAASTLAKESKKTATEMRDEFADAVKEVRGIAGNLTESFPIGWNRYPQCPENSPDTRCLASEKENVSPDSSSAWPQWHISKPSNWDIGGTIQGIFWVPTSIIMWPFEAAVWYLRPYYDNDPQGFFRWLFGVLTTGILVGLGSPFWVRVVNELLEGRKKLKGDKKEEEET